MMDMRPEDFKKENKVLTIAQVLDTMSTDELTAVVAQAQAHIEERKRDARRDEIMAELTYLFAELDELGVEYYFGAPARNGGTDCYIITGEVVLDEDEVIIY